MGALQAIDLPSIRFGQPEEVEKAAEAAARLFDHSSRNAASPTTAYAAALMFLRGQLSEEDDWQHDLLAGALAIRIREQEGKTVLGAGDRFDRLLARYRDQIQRGEMWRLVWYGLLTSYFALDANSRPLEEELRGWKKLRALLAATWRLYAEAPGVQPAWVSSLRLHHEVLSDRASAPYADAALQGDMSQVDSLSRDLGIPQSSWFWHQLVLEVTRAACGRADDAEFKFSLDRVVELLRERPVFRDYAIELILRRFHRCDDKTPHQLFRDYVVAKEVWKNPKLKAAGIATSWTRVSEDIWRMALGWVNEANLRLFFELLSARNNAEEGRLAFWSRYLEQISWTKLVFGADTRSRARHDAQLRALIEQEHGTAGRLLSNDDRLDAFLMEIGDYVIVEFSRKPNAAYIYRKGDLPFDAHQERLSDSTEVLKAGFTRNHSSDRRILHMPEWEARATGVLRSIGIYPDAEVNRLRTAREAAIRQSQPSQGRPVSIQGSTPRGRFTMSELIDSATTHGAAVDDRRPDGALWVNYSEVASPFALQLKIWGFRYSDRRNAWYLRDE